jgi:uncharacterized RDD family membrane protein YckC
MEAAEPQTTNSAYCSQCGNRFAVDEMIRYGSAYVCANCKPAFMQRLAEGAEIVTGEMRYAGFWRRYGAVFLDGVILSVVNIGMSLMAGVSFSQRIGAAQPNLGLTLVLWVIQIVVGISYETFMIGKYGATLGKMAARVHVVTAEGGRVSYLRAAGRYLAKLLSTATLLIGYIIAAFDSEKRALHDLICNTRVVLE